MCGRYALYGLISRHRANKIDDELPEWWYALVDQINERLRATTLRRLTACRWSASTRKAALNDYRVRNVVPGQTPTERDAKRAV
jgi:hypothetical protein